jgi:hypothetical protein
MGDADAIDVSTYYHLFVTLLYFGNFGLRATGEMKAQHETHHKRLFEQA